MYTHTHTHTPLSSLLLLVLLVLRLGTLLNNQWQSSSLGEMNSPPSSQQRPVVLYLGVAPCKIPFFHTDWSLDTAVVSVLLMQHFKGRVIHRRRQGFLVLRIFLLLLLRCSLRYRCRNLWCGCICRGWTLHNL